MTIYEPCERKMKSSFQPLTAYKLRLHAHTQKVIVANSCREPAH